MQIWGLENKLHDGVSTFIIGNDVTRRAREGRLWTDIKQSMEAISTHKEDFIPFSFEVIVSSVLVVHMRKVQDLNLFYTCK